MNKKIAASILAGGLVMGLAACSAGQDVEPSSGFDTELPPSDVEATLEVWGYVDPEASPWLGDGLARMEERFPNVDVSYTFVPYDQVTPKLLGTVATGGGPDAVLYNPADAPNLAESGVLGDMTPFWDEFEDAELIAPSTVTRNGDAIVALQGYVNTTALYYNENILNELGVAPPETVQELEAALAAATAAGYGGMTMSAINTPESEFQLLPWLFGEGLNYDAWDAAVLTDTFTMFTDWIDQGYLPRDIVNWTQNDAWDVFSAGQYAFTQNGNWQLGSASELPFDWGVVEIPEGSAGSSSVGGGEGFSILADAENAALAWNLFEDTLLTAEAELDILDQQGSIPVRADAAQAPQIADSPALTVFSDVVSNMTARPASPEVGPYLAIVGEIWNSLAGGTISPEQAADRIVKEVSVE